MITMKILRKIVSDLKPLSWEEGKRTKFSRETINLLYGENPLPQLDVVKKKIIAELDKMNLYPESMGYNTIDLISEATSFSDKNIVVDNGIDGVLNLLAKTIIDPGDNVIVTPPTFPVYASTTKLMNGIVTEVTLEDDFSLDINKLMKAINEKTKVIYISNPNNPTGNILLTNKQIEFILNNFSGLLVIDECYYGICKETAIDLVNKYDNIIILRSFSKALNLAGLRIGYAVGPKYLISAMKQVLNDCNPFVLNRLSQASSIAIRYQDILSKQFISSKKRFKSKLESINKLKIIDTETSFLLADVSKIDIKASEIISKLSNRGILIKDCSVYGFEDIYLRISIPKKELEDKVITNLREVVDNICKGKLK